MGKRSIAVFALGFLAGVLVGGLVFTATAPRPERPPQEASGKPAPQEPDPELVDLRSVFQQIPDDELLYRFPSDAFLSLLDMMESGRVLGTEDERWEALMLLGEVFGHLENLKEKPFYQARFKVGENMARHPILKDYTVASAWSAPWMVFAVGTRIDEDRLALRVLAKRAAAELGGLYRRVVDLIGERFDLPELSTMENLDQRILKVVVFRRKALFVEYHRKSGRSIYPGTLALYSEDERFALTFGELESPRQRSNLRYAAAHQLLHAYRKIVMERETGREFVWEDHKFHCRLHLFSVGLTSLLADGPEGTLHVSDLKWARELDLDGWSLEEVLSIRTGPELDHRARRKGLSRAHDLTILFHAQAWAFVHFLWHFEDGKYRERFLEYVGMELRGRTGPDEFRKAFWGEEKPDLERLNNEWRRHVEELLAD